MATRILFLTQWFDPEPTPKGFAFARALVQCGFEVEVVTGFPNYPGGKLYSGYKIRLMQREYIDGVRITRVPLYPSHDSGALKRILNYTSFAGSALVYGLFGARRPGVIYAYHPPLTVGIAAVIMRFFRRVPVVYDIQDMWPDTLRATGMFTSEKGLKLVSKVCRWVYRRVDFITVLSPGFKRLLMQRGVPQSKIQIIYNWCDEDSIRGSIRTEDDTSVFPVDDKFRILFAGNLGRAQALEAVLDAAEQTAARAPNIMFVFLGGGLQAQTLREQAISRQLTNVTFLPPVPMADVGKYLVDADALLVHLRKDPLFTLTIPSKTQAYMAVGKPILMAVEGDAAELVEAARCGILAQSEDAASIAEAAIKLASASLEERNEMADNAREFYKNNLALGIGVEKFSAIFHECAIRGTKQP